MSKQPLSVAEILERQRQESALKPRFLSKAERAAKAQQEQQEQERQRAIKQEQERKSRSDLEQQARAVASSSRHPARPAGRDSDRYHRHNGDLDYGSADAKADERGGRSLADDRDIDGRSNGHSQASNGHSDRSPTNGDSAQASDAPLTESEQASIRRRYLGLKDDKKKPRRKPTDKSLSSNGPKKTILLPSLCCPTPSASQLVNTDRNTNPTLRPARPTLR